jgi:hypothetical protein
MKTTILLEVHHTEKTTDLIDKIAGRAWTIDGVKDVIAKLQVPEKEDQELPALLKKQAS